MSARPDMESKSDFLKERLKVIILRKRPMAAFLIFPRLWLYNPVSTLITEGKVKIINGPVKTKEEWITAVISCVRCHTNFVLEEGDEKSLNEVFPYPSPAYPGGLNPGWLEAECPVCGKWNKLEFANI